MALSERRKRQRVARGYSSEIGRRPAPSEGRPYTTPGTKIRIVDDWIEVTPIGGDDRSTDIGPGDYTIETRYDRKGNYDGKKIYSRKTGKGYYVHDASYKPTKEMGHIVYLDDNWKLKDKPKKKSLPKKKRGPPKVREFPIPSKKIQKRSKTGDTRPVLIDSRGGIFHRTSREMNGKVLLSNLENNRSHWVSISNLENLYKKKRRDEVDIDYRRK